MQENKKIDNNILNSSFRYVMVSLLSVCIGLFLKIIINDNYGINKLGLFVLFFTIYQLFSSILTLNLPLSSAKLIAGLNKISHSTIPWFW